MDNLGTIFMSVAKDGRERGRGGAGGKEERGEGDMAWELG